MYNKKNGLIFCGVLLLLIILAVCSAGSSRPKTVDQFIRNYNEKIKTVTASRVSDTNSGGYAASEMRRTGLDRAKSMINGAFGAEHILTDYDVELMTFDMVYEDKKLNLFRLRTDFREADTVVYWYWLQDTVSAAYFARVISIGGAASGNASTAGGVRPAFAVY